MRASPGGRRGRDAVGECEGLGFGCTLPDRDVIAVYGVVLGAAVVPTASVVLAVLAWLDPGGRRHLVGGSLAAFAAGALTLGLFAALGG